MHKQHADLLRKNFADSIIFKPDKRNMNLKQQAAKEAVTCIKDEMIIGLGAGATMAYMVQYLQEQNIHAQVILLRQL